MKTSLALLALTFSLPSVHAQWTNDPLQNLPITTAPGLQSFAKIAATSDGGCWIGWVDSSPSFSTVRLQYLDAFGNPAFGASGLLVSQQLVSLSPAIEWDLLCDREDHCVLVYPDVRAGLDRDVYAYRIDSRGTHLWGANGVALSNNSDSESEPRVCETTNGDFVFAWANTGAADLRVQRLDRSGNALYPTNGLVVSVDPNTTPGALALVASDAGGFILSWVRTITSPGIKHLHAQKFDVQGSPLWNGGTRLPVFDVGAISNLDPPRLVSDGTGGAVLAWSAAGVSYSSVHVQHVLANGTKAFPPEGVDVSTNANFRTDFTITHRVVTGETFVCWNESANGSPSTWGVLAQKIDASGQRAFGPTGLTLLPIDGTRKSAPVVVPLVDGFVCNVLEESLGNGNDKVLSMRVDGSGHRLWSQPVEASQVATPKSGLVNAITGSGVTLLAWTDESNFERNVFAQNVNPNGTLGDAFGSYVSYGCGVNPIGSLITSSRPALGTTSFLLLDNPLGTQSPGSLAFLVLGTQPDPAFPCGTPIPGLGMNGGAGEILIPPAFTAATLGPVSWSGAGQPVAYPVALPLDLNLAGFPIYAQGVFLDVTPGAAVPLGLTTGVVANVGF